MEIECENKMNIVLFIITGSLEPVMTDTFEVLIHECVCKFYGLTCKALLHSCVCRRRSDITCLHPSYHDCICLLQIKQCLSLAHNCRCHINPTICISLYHNCFCNPNKQGENNSPHSFRKEKDHNCS